MAKMTSYILPEVKFGLAGPYKIGCKLRIAIINLLALI